MALETILGAMGGALSMCIAFVAGYRVGVAKGRATAWSAALSRVVGLFRSDG